MWYVCRPYDAEPNRMRVLGHFNLESTARWYAREVNSTPSAATLYLYFGHPREADCRDAIDP